MLRIETQHISSEELLTVAEVRRCLATLRRLWEDAHAQASSGPMYLIQSLPNENFSIQDFALKFVLSHHTKRQAKPRAQKSC